jgi:hypothetical protein
VKHQDQIVIQIEDGGLDDAGYLRLLFSEDLGLYYTDIVMTRVAARGKGIAARLLTIATDLLGYTPPPEVIFLERPAVKHLWAAFGFTSGFNQSKFD